MTWNVGAEAERGGGKHRGKHRVEPAEYQHCPRVRAHEAVIALLKGTVGAVFFREVSLLELDLDLIES